MRTPVLALLVLLSCAAPAVAQSRPMPLPQSMPRSESSSDGDESGKSSYVNRDSDDSTRDSESDSSADSESNGTTPSNTYQRGVDSQGNVWTYNPRTGTYWSSSGRVCVGGRGSARGCY